MYWVYLEFHFILIVDFHMSPYDAYMYVNINMSNPLCVQMKDGPMSHFRPELPQPGPICSAGLPLVVTGPAEARSVLMATYSGQHILPPITGTNVWTQ